MKWLRNEKGNAAFFMLWLLGIVAIIFVLTINIVKVYIVKEHSSLSAEQAALAGTAVLIENTAEAIENYERNPSYMLIREVHELADGKPISALIEDRKNEYLNSGRDESAAYIEAVNDVLTKGRLEWNGFLKQELRNQLSETKAGAEAIIYPEVMNVITANHARQEDTEITFSLDKWRVEVKSTVRFESISDNKYISNFVEDIPQRGYGPKLAYIENVYTGGMNWPDPPSDETE
jgi:hypothetical protein